MYPPPTDVPVNVLASTLNQRERFAAAYSVLQSAIADHAFPGAAFGVLLDGKILALDGVGRFTYGPESPAVTPMTVFDLASVTKVMAAAAAAMLLYDRKRLDLDLLVGDLLPGFAIGAQLRSEWHRERRRITLRHLLAHSSGLPAYARLFEANRTPYALLEACLSTPLEASPGTRAEYSDIGFILLGKALEVLAREPLDVFCAREIFAPLALTATRYQPPPTWRALIPPTVDDQTFRGRIIQGEVHDENCYVLGGVSGHAGLFSNALDVLRFASCVISSGAELSNQTPSQGAQLFTSATIQLFASRQNPPAESSRALGWDTPSGESSSGRHFGPRSIGHLGYTGTSLWIDLERRLAIALLTNRPARLPRRRCRCFIDYLRHLQPHHRHRSSHSSQRSSISTVAAGLALELWSPRRYILKKMATITTNAETQIKLERPQHSAATLNNLTTESANEASLGFDTKSALEIARIINHEDSKIAAAVKKALPEIALVIDSVARSLRDGGRLIYVGAGSSGRIAALDACECPPYFSTPAQSVQYIMAGGPKALASAVEVNEDSEELGQRDIARRRPTRKDMVIGLSSSGRTPYVVAAVAYARARGAKTAAITCNQNTPLSDAADIVIVAEVGPEVISGSTRMKAATAQKMVTNMITTGAMTRLGYVYDNAMVNVHMQNSKLVERGISTLMRTCGIDRDTAVMTIKSAGRSIPVALVMLKAGVDKPEAVRRLAKSDGNVRLAIEDTTLEL
jgi:N-acetylmuramic acid 6-phosphate etherase